MAVPSGTGPASQCSASSSFVLVSSVSKTAPQVMWVGAKSTQESQSPPPPESRSDRYLSLSVSPLQGRIINESAAGLRLISQLLLLYY